MKKQMIKRKDGSYSQRGLWDNIRANRGSGKKPTAEMLKQERKIKANMAEGGINNPGFKALPSYVQAKIRANMQEGGVTGPMSAMSAVIEKSAQPMMQMGGMMPQSTAGKSVLQEAMMMSQMQNGGKMPSDIARARFMAAAKGDVTKAKETASKYGYKMQGGGFGGPVMTPGQPGFNFQQASAAAVADPTLAPPTDVERMQDVNITKKRSFSEKLAGKYRQTKKALGFDPYPKTQAQQGRESVFAQGASDKAELDAVVAQSAAKNKKQDRNLGQKIGDDFGTYLNLSSDRNVLTDIADMSTMAASKLNMPTVAANIQAGKQTIKDFGQSYVGKALDLVNPLSVGASLTAGTIGTAGDIEAGDIESAKERAATTTALAATKGIAGKTSEFVSAPIGKAVTKLSDSKIGHAVQHQLAHAGQHKLLSPLLAHKKGGSIKDMYKMQTGGYQPYRLQSRGNYSGSDNTMVANNPAQMRAQQSKDKAYLQSYSTSQGRAQMQKAKQTNEANIAAKQKAKQAKEAAVKSKKVSEMKARIEDSKKVQDMSLSDQFKPENIERATQATGDKLRLFGPSSPLVTSGLFSADPDSFVDNYLNPAKFVGDMASNLGKGINESYQTGEIAPVAKALATPVIAGATMSALHSPIHGVEKKASEFISKNINRTSLSGATAGLTQKGLNQAVKQGATAAEHDIVHRTTSPTMLGEHKNGGTIKDMYMMKKGGQFPDRYKKMGFSGVDKPKRTPGGSKSHAVVTKVGGNYKLIRFGQQGVSGSPDGSARNKAFKARHAKNIAKGKSSAAYWANKIKW